MNGRDSVKGRCGSDPGKERQVSMISMKVKRIEAALAQKTR